MKSDIESECFYVHYNSIVNENQDENQNQYGYCFPLMHVWKCFVQFKWHRHKIKQKTSFILHIFGNFSLRIRRSQSLIYDLSEKKIQILKLRSNIFKGQIR